MKTFKCGKCDILEGESDYLINIPLCRQCGERMQPLIGNSESVAKSPACNDGLDTLCFKGKHLLHLLDIAEELLSLCNEPDKKNIWKDTLEKYRKEYEDVKEKGV